MNAFWVLKHALGSGESNARSSMIVGDVEMILWHQTHQIVDFVKMKFNFVQNEAEYSDERHFLNGLSRLQSAVENFLGMI